MRLIVAAQVGTLSTPISQPHSIVALPIWLNSICKNKELSPKSEENTKGFSEQGNHTYKVE